MAECDIIIPIWNQLELTKKCIESIRRNTKIPYRLILIDNASEDETRIFLEGQARAAGDITLIRNENNLGFIKAVNRGIRESSAPYVCLMNNDTEAQGSWLTEMIKLADSRPDIGLINPISKAAHKLNVGERKKYKSDTKNRFMESSQCMGFCMLIKREVIAGIGYLDEAYGIGGFDDTDFSMRAHRAGYKCMSAFNAHVDHTWHTSFNEAGNREGLAKTNEKIFTAKWGTFLRVAYPVLVKREEELLSNFNTALSLAREWNWVHAWFGFDGRIKKKFEALNLPGHQGLRFFRLSSSRIIFFAGVIFRLIERALKGKKQFDAVLITDKRVFKVLSRFKELIKTPIFFIDEKRLSKDIKDEASWTNRANAITKIIKEGIK